MKRIFFFLLLFISLASSAQVRISELPEHTTNPNNGWLPLTISGQTRKFNAGNFLWNGGSYSNPSWLISIAPNKLLQAGATPGQGLIWNGTSWSPGQITAIPFQNLTGTPYNNNALREALDSMVRRNRTLTINGISQDLSTNRTWTLNSTNIAEGSNLYFTDARSRSAISLTTTGTTGAATYNSSTGVLNIPQYQALLTNPVTGTGSSGRVTFWNGVNTVTSASSFTYSLNQLGLQGTSLTDAGQLSANLLSSSGWSTTDWTGDFTTGFTHTTGNTTTLTNTLPAVVNTYYLITFTTTSRTAGSYNITFGGQSLIGITGTSAFSLRASTTGSLIVTPTSDFNGTVSIQIQSVSASQSIVQLRNAGNSTTFEIRANNGATNTFAGLDAGSFNIGNNNNTAFGSQALRFNVNASANTAIGRNALTVNASGTNNTSIGAFSMQSNVAGAANVAIGANSLLNSNGNNNVAIGNGAAISATTPSRLIAIGSSSAEQGGTESIAIGHASARLANSLATVVIGDAAAFNLITATNNVIIGKNAGNTLSVGGNLTNISNSVLIGSGVQANADAQFNQIVIGNLSIGLGSNTTVIGNNNTSFGRWWGNLLLGSSVNNGVDIFQVTGSALVGNLRTSSNTISSTNTNGNIILDANGTGIVQINDATTIQAGLTAQRGRLTSLILNKDSINRNTANNWILTIDTTGALGSNIVNRRNISDFYVGDATFDTTARTLTIPKAGGGSTSVVIPRGTASGSSGILALSSSRTGNIVTVSGDNGAFTQFSIRDSDSSASLSSLTNGYGIVGTPYNGSSALTWRIDTANLATLAQVNNLLNGYVPTSRTINGQSLNSNLTLSTSNIAEGSNLYFTDARAISALTGQNVSIFNNNAGYITSSALTPYALLSGATFTGDVALSGGAGNRQFTIQNNVSGNAILAFSIAGVDVATITYNRSNANLVIGNSSATNALTIAPTGAVEFTGALSGTSAIFSSSITSQNSISAVSTAPSFVAALSTTDNQQIRMRMVGVNGWLDVTRNSGTVPDLILGTEGTERMRLVGATGAATFSNSVTADGIIRVLSGNSFALNRPDNGAASGLNTNSSNELVLTAATGSTLTIGSTSIFSNSVTATQFNGSGAGLTGTASSLSIGGNAATVTNGVYTNGSYANPAWITSLAWSKITGAPSFLTSAVTSATGTANQITVSASTGAVTFSLPSAVTISGNMTAAAFFESSDIRQKKVHKTLVSKDGIDAIQYTFLPDGKSKWGYSAQQVKNIVPFAVTEGSDGFLKVDYTTIHTFKIASLEKRIAELEKQLNK